MSFSTDAPLMVLDHADEPVPRGVDLEVGVAEPGSRRVSAGPVLGTGTRV